MLYVLSSDWWIIGLTPKKQNSQALVSCIYICLLSTSIHRHSLHIYIFVCYLRISTGTRFIVRIKQKFICIAYLYSKCTDCRINIYICLLSTSIHRHSFHIYICLLSTSIQRHSFHIYICLLSTSIHRHSFHSTNKAKIYSYSIFVQQMYSLQDKYIYLFTIYVSP
jgi:hypothetical protein